MFLRILDINTIRTLMFKTEKFNSEKNKYLVLRISRKNQNKYSTNTCSF